MRHFRHLLLTACLLAAAATAQADLVVVMRAQGSPERLAHGEVTNIFMGRYRTLPDGSTATPLDQPPGPLRDEFYRRLVNKDAAAISAYWSRLYFSGKAMPPQSARSHGEAAERVLNERGTITYMERGRIDPRLRIVFEFPPEQP